MSCDISGLITWYLSHCDGLWEHEHFGIKISTFDNPALGLRIDLNGTELENKVFEKFTENYSADDTDEVDWKIDLDWVICRKTDDNYFEGVSHPRAFKRVVEVFLQWSKIAE